MLLPERMKVWHEPLRPAVQDGWATGRTLCVAVRWRGGKRALVMASVCAGRDSALAWAARPHAELMARHPGTRLGRLLLLCWMDLFVGLRVSVLRGGVL